MSFSLFADNGFRNLEGETINSSGTSTQFSASYKIGDFTLTAFWTDWLQGSKKTNEAEIINHFVRKNITMRTRDYSDFIGIRLTWNISKGRKYANIQRSAGKKGSDMGILLLILY